MTAAKYATTLQPISVYGYRIATVTVLTAGDAATTVVFDRPVSVLAKLEANSVTAIEPTTTGEGTDAVTTPAAATIPANTAVGTRLYFLVQ